MIRSMLAASAVYAALAFAAPALAQPPGQIAILDGDASESYRAAGAVTAEISLAASGAALPKQRLDEMLRAEAQKLGADAVILVTYTLTSPATPNAAHRASGVAIRYNRAVAVASAPPPVAAPPAIAPAPERVIVNTPLMREAPPSPPPVVAAAIPPPAPVIHAASAASVLLASDNLPGRRYTQLGPVTVTVHQKALFTKVSEQQQAQEALQAAAFAMGADAVINVTYKFTNGAWSKEGDTGKGIAVRFE